MKVTAESTIGQNSLKTVIKDLKICSENEANNNNRNLSHWVESLRSFKNIYSALVTEGASDTSCIFINK